MSMTARIARTALAVAAVAILMSGCGTGSSMALFTIPSDYTLQTADIGLGMGTPQVQDIRDYPRDTDHTLIVVQLSYHADSALRCYDDQNQKLPFVGTLVDVNAGVRSALLARELQIMCDKGTVAYVFSVPRNTKTIVVGPFGKRDVSQAGSVLPPITAADLKIRKIVRERD